MHTYIHTHTHTHRKSVLHDLLSSNNRCDLESCSEQLALHGPVYVEALLWLYRSKGEHEIVLSALQESKCILPAGLYLYLPFFLYFSPTLSPSLPLSLSHSISLILFFSLYILTYGCISHTLSISFSLYLLLSLSPALFLSIGCWTQTQFYHWTADYLRWLW